MRIQTLSAIFLSLSLSHPLFAFHEHDMSGQCPKSCLCENMKEMKNKLALTADQKAKVQQIRAKYRHQIMANKTAMKTNKEKIHAMTHSSSMDEKSLNQLIQQQSNLMAQRMKLKAMIKHQIYQILTPTQKSQFNEMEKNMRKAHHKHCHHE